MNIDSPIQPLLQKKGWTVHSVAEEATVFEALVSMADKGVGALVVLDGERLIGIFSERDYARKVILAGRSSKETKVGEIMSRQVHTVGLQSTASECMQHMTDKRCRHLPVVEGGKVIGIVSIGDHHGTERDQSYDGDRSNIHRFSIAHARRCDGQAGKPSGSGCATLGSWIRVSTPRPGLPVSSIGPRRPTTRLPAHTTITSVFASSSSLVSGLETRCWMWVAGGVPCWCQRRRESGETAASSASTCHRR